MPDIVDSPSEALPLLRSGHGGIGEVERRGGMGWEIASEGELGLVSEMKNIFLNKETSMDGSVAMARTQEKKGQEANTFPSRGLLEAGDN